MYIKDFYQSPATTVCVLASPHPVVSVESLQRATFAKLDKKSREVEVKGWRGL